MENNPPEKLAGMDKLTENRLLLAWKLIKDQFFSKSVQVSNDEGPGISIYQMLRSSKGNGTNCKYYYAGKDSHHWKIVLENSGNMEEMEKIYDPTKHVIICIQVPLGAYGEETMGNVKLFEIENEKEVDDEIRENNKQETKTDNTKTPDNLGLRHRPKAKKED